MRVIRERGDPLYKPHHIFVLDPLEYVALCLNVLKGRKGEERLEQMRKAKFAHPDHQKIALVAHGALIYTALYPDKTHKDMRPPEAWMHMAGITEGALWEARKQLTEEDPEWQAKADLRREVQDAMDQATLATKQ
jgi:hypothetical protein